MSEYRETAGDFLNGIAYIDEIKYKGKPVFVRAKNKDVVGVVLYQGNERRGYEFLMLHDRGEFEAFGDELRDYGITPEFIEIDDDEKITLTTHNEEVPSKTYVISVNKERKQLEVECVQLEKENPQEM